MTLLRPSLVLAAAAVAAAAPRLRPQGPVETLDRAARVFKQAKTVRATFEQTLKNPLTGTEARATGELFLEQPNRMAVTFTRPAGDRVVSDGKWLWVYLPSSAPNQVIKLPAKSKGVSGVDMVGELLTAPTARYEVADAGAATVGGRATHAVLLTPKASGGAIDKAIVWVDDADASLRQFEVTDANGLVRTVRMTSWTTNAGLPSGAFRFTVPNGVRVVDQSMLPGQS
jgi:outer membrane lipoprotein carrier protein